jgi:uncharacterized protein (DUF488 family)
MVLLPGDSWTSPYQRLLARAGDLLTEGLDELEQPLALMCSEADHRACHRSIVADHLVATREWAAVNL